MSQTRTFHKENCNTVVRKTFISAFGDVITLTGTHAFEWAVIIDSNNTTTKTTYANRKLAIRAYNNLVRAYK